MSRRSSESGRIHVVALIVLALLLIGVGAWYASWHRVTAVPHDNGAAVPDTSSDAAIDQALKSAVVDSTAIKARWLDEVPGMDVSALSAPQREIFLSFANSQHCTCGCGYTLAGCRASDMSCEVSGPRLLALLDSVQTGRIKSARGARSRPTTGG